MSIKAYKNSAYNVEMGQSVASFEVPSTDHQPTFGSGTNSKLKWILIVFLVVFIILAAVFIGLYGYEKHKTPTDTTVVKSYCKSEGCIKVSSNILADMNSSVNPCEDFYEYACGRWMKNNPIPDTSTSWGQFSILAKENEEVMKRLILDPKTRTKYSKNKAVVKAFDYFDSCMDEKEIERLDAQPLQKLIKDYGSWNVTDKIFNVSSWDFMGTYVGIHKYLGIATLFNMYVGPDFKDSTKNMIEFDQSGLGLSREIYLYNTTTQYANYRNSYKILMTDLMKLLGAGDEAEARMNEVYNFEKQLASISIPREQYRDTNKIYKKMTLKEFNKVFGVNATLNVTEFLERMFVETGYKITDNEIIGVYAVEYFRNVTKVINGADKRIMANYMMWHVVKSFAYYLSKRFVDVYVKHSERLSGTIASSPRWKDCITSVKGAFGMAVGLLFVDKKFGGGSKTAAEEMIHNIRSSFIDNMKDIDWMDPETKKVAQEKAEGIRENIGYPSYITDPTDLAKKYEGFDVTKKTLFQNVLNNGKFNNMKNYQGITKPVDKTTWGMTPPTVNAYYSPTENKMVFPAGILQTPFFDLTFPISLNYGAIGMVVGHEISHGFDDMGRKFNKDGNLIKWWTNSSIVNFQKKTECLVKQYNNYTFHGYHLNGRKTLGENIADNGGMKATYRAYQQWKEKHGEEQMLPGLEEFSHEKLFFLGFAQIWCTAFRQSAALNAIQYDVHSPGKFRVIGTLVNNYEFAKAYKCPVGSKMNPKDKCSVW